MVKQAQTAYTIILLAIAGSHNIETTASSLSPSLPHPPPSSRHPYPSLHLHVLRRVFELRFESEWNNMHIKNDVQRIRILYADIGAAWHAVAVAIAVNVER